MYVCVYMYVYVYMYVCVCTYNIYIVLQEIGWFDEEKNSTGALTTRLSEDAAQVQGVSYE